MILVKRVTQAKTERGPATGLQGGILTDIRPGASDGTKHKVLPALKELDLMWLQTCTSARTQRCAAKEICKELSV